MRILVLARFTSMLLKTVVLATFQSSHATTTCSSEITLIVQFNSNVCTVYILEEQTAKFVDFGSKRSGGRVLNGIPVKDETWYPYMASTHLLRKTKYFPFY